MIFGKEELTVHSKLDRERAPVGWFKPALDGVTFKVHAGGAPWTLVQVQQIKGLSPAGDGILEPVGEMQSPRIKNR